ncbi:transmembrane protein, putative [Bodo saltans]|uniref:Transmembrane protein, putative n=1 Tax=Bodo saltans TaxID=75058 RepID=A0A0S4IT98_BODSA|nr:transmembrane protein, putative [Bodo saltans]|eukprot:CUF69651.1 transmembrane protein, putative [Bodo saltans]
MVLDIVSVAFGFTELPGRQSRDTKATSVAPSTYLQVGSGVADIYPMDSPVFVAVKKALHQKHPAGGLCFNRQWSLQVEGADSGSSNSSNAPDAATSSAPLSSGTVQAAFKRVDFFITSWSASIQGLLDTPCSPGRTTPQQQGPPNHPAWSWETVRHQIPQDVSSVRLWGSSLPNVLKQTKLASGGHTSLKGSFGSISSATSNSTSPKSSLLKFTQCTITIPIQKLIAPIAASEKSTIGDGSDFANSRIIRVDVLRSALNELALLILGGGAAPTEELSSEPSVPETPTYRSSIGVVGIQVAWAPASPPLSGKAKSTSSTGSSSTANGPSDGDEPSTHGYQILARDVVLEIQLLSQTSSNAGKKAIDLAIRELIAAPLLEAPSCLSIGVANQQDGSVSNVSLSSPPLHAQQTPKIVASPLITKSHASWSAAVTGGTPKSGGATATPKQASGAAAAGTSSFPGLGPSVATKADQSKSTPDVSPKPPVAAPKKTATTPRVPIAELAKPTIPASSSPSAAAPASASLPTVPSTAAASTPAAPPALSAATLDDAKKKKLVRKAGDTPPSSGASAAPPTTPLAPSPTKVLEEDIIKQSNILLMHANDISMMEMQFDEILRGPPVREASKKNPPEAAAAQPSKKKDKKDTTASGSAKSELTSSGSPPSDELLRRSLGSSLGSSSSGGVTVPSTLAPISLILGSDSPLLAAFTNAITTALIAQRAACVHPEVRAFAQGDMESTIGPTSKMLTLAVSSSNLERMGAYRTFQQERKVLLMDAVSSYSNLFSNAESLLAVFDGCVQVVKDQAAEWGACVAVMDAAWAQAGVVAAKKAAKKQPTPAAPQPASQQVPQPEPTKPVVLAKSTPAAALPAPVVTAAPAPEPVLPAAKEPVTKPSKREPQTQPQPQPPQTSSVQTQQSQPTREISPKGPKAPAKESTIPKSQLPNAAVAQKTKRNPMLKNMFILLAAFAVAIVAAMFA